MNLTTFNFYAAVSSVAIRFAHFLYRVMVMRFTLAFIFIIFCMSYLFRILNVWWVRWIQQRRIWLTWIRIWVIWYVRYRIGWVVAWRRIAFSCHTFWRWVMQWWWRVTCCPLSNVFGELGTGDETYYLLHEYFLNHLLIQCLSKRLESVDLSWCDSDQHKSSRNISDSKLQNFCAQLLKLQNYFCVQHAWKGCCLQGFYFNFSLRYATKIPYRGYSTSFWRSLRCCSCLHY